MSNSGNPNLICYSQRGTAHTSNRDYISCFDYDDSILVLLIDIATISPLEGDSFIDLFNELICRTVTHDHLQSKELFLDSIEQIVNKLKCSFKIGVASMITVHIPINSVTVWGYTVGDARFGKIRNNDIIWLTNVHTGANPLGEIFTEEMKILPERRLLTRALNMRKSFEPDYFELDNTEALPIVIASDGFWADLPLEDQKLLLAGKTLETDDDCSLVQINHPISNIEFCNSTQSNNIQYFKLNDLGITPCDNK